MSPDATGAPAPKRPKPWLIALPTLGFLLLVALYSYYWFATAADVERGFRDWAAAMAAEGYAVAYDQAEVSGYPTRLALVIDGPDITAPDGWRWQAERVMAHMLPYRLSHVIVTADGTHRVTEGNQTTTLVSPDARASIVNAGDGLLRVSTDIKDGVMTIVRKNAAPDTGAASSAATETIRFARAQFHTRPAMTGEIPQPGDYDVMLRIDEMDVAGAADDAALEVFGPLIKNVYIEGRIEDLPQTAAADNNDDLFRAWAKNGGALTLSDSNFVWGPLGITATGRMGVDAAHRPEGGFRTLIAGHGKLLEALARGEVITDDQATVGAAGLDLLAAAGGDPDGRLVIRTEMREGWLFLGPIPIGELEPLF